eukprot:jgi/Chlat1/5279/Chrsp35S05191
MAAQQAAREEGYDVFLCHRGPDTKRTFSAWLNRELKRQKLRVFFDDRILCMGDLASVEMDSAMRTAKCGIVVLSPQFFESYWCMKELRVFLDRGNCMPACYHITPDDIDAEAIKNKKVGTAWEHHGGQLWTKCGMNEADWTQVICELAVVCMDVMSKHDNYEDTYVDSIVQKVCKRLRRVCTTGKRVNTVPYRDKKLFIGRSQEMTELKNMLKDECGCVCIQGMGGSGKTHLALKYAYSHKNQYDKLLWIAASKDLLQVNFLGLAAPLGISLGAVDTGSGTMHSSVRDPNRDGVLTIRTALEQSETPCLLVLDNVDDEHQYPGYLPRKGPCHVILTARQRMYSTSQGLLELKNLEEMYACQLLRSGLPPETPDAKVKELAAALGCHALSLSVSAKLMHEYGSGPEWVLNLLNTKGVEIFNQELDDPEFQISPRLTTLFATSMQMMLSDARHPRQAVALARIVLRLGGWFAAAPIRLDLLKQAACTLLAKDVSIDNIHVAAGLLNKYALAERTLDAGIAFHPLVQSFGRWDGKKEGVQIAQAAVLAIAEVGKVGQDTEHFAYAVSMALPEGGDPSGIKVPLDADYLQRVIDVALALASFYIDLYETAKAWSILHRCERISQQVECQDMTLLPHLWTLQGACLTCEGRYGKAEALHRRALAICEAQLGSDHPDTATSLNNLASVLRKLGKLDDAEALHRRALAIREAQLGSDHPKTATSLNNLATVLYQLGKLDDAEALHRRALAIWEAKLGSDHPNTAKSLDNLASVLCELGKHDDAEALHRRALAIREAQLGSDHPDTATSLNNLASVLCELGKLDDAEALHRRALAIREAQLGSDHPDTATSLSNLASVLCELGKLDDAEALHRRAVAICEAQLGSDHPNTAKSLTNLASVLYELGKLNDAEALHRRALAIREAQLGSDHPDTATSLNNLASVLCELGKLDDAEALHRRALAIREAQLGSDHPDTATSLSNLASVLCELGKLDDAEALHRRAVAICEAQLGSDHPNTARSRRNLARVLGDLGKHDDAEALRRRNS